MRTSVVAALVLVWGTPVVLADAPKPPAEIATLAKRVAGTWTCAGTRLVDPTRPGVTADVRARATVRLGELGRWWIQVTLDVPIGKTRRKVLAYATFDPADKRWRGYDIDNLGGAAWTSSFGPKDDKIVWEGEAMVGPFGKHAVRHHADLGNRRTLKVVGEVALDGKTWIESYRAICRR